ncbi:MAG: response regulator transcription factor [Acidovorax sp.]|uniref:response regulator transcription factor n=1 Tax=Acidovorax sp. TaxID=1872122 RepID=UPI00391CBA29
MPPKFIISVVEDDEDIRGNVCRYLECSGFKAWGADSAEDFYVRLLRDRADLVVVDIGLPGEDGLSLVTRLAAQGVPTVLMTARADLDSRIAGLDAGALQYFVKPVDMQELTAGIRSQLRYLTPRAAQGGALAPWRLDQAASRLVAPNQSSVDLTSRELELLGCLMVTPGAMVTKQTLTEAMGADEAEDGFHRIESQLTRLRRKTMDTTGTALPVRAVFGKGLVFVP